MRPSSRALARSWPIDFSSIFPEVRLGDSLDDRREGRRRRGAIEEPPPLSAKLVVKRHEPIAERGEGGRIVQRRGDIRGPSREALPTLPIDPVARELFDRPAGALAEAGVVEAACARADDGATVGEQSLVGQVIERREQLALSQIAGRTELIKRRVESANDQFPGRRTRSSMELAGLEPATSWVRSRRSPALSLACLQGFRGGGGSV